MQAISKPASKPLRRSRSRKPQSGLAKFFSAQRGLIILVLVLAGLFLEFERTITKEIVNPLMDRYAQALPVPLPKSGLSEAQFAALKQRLDNFANQIEKNAPTSFLALSSEELNALIEHDPELRNQVALTLYQDVIQADMSLEVPGSGRYKRYLNGQGAFKLLLNQGSLSIKILGVQIGDSRLSDSIVKSMNLEDLGKSSMEDPEVRRVLSKLKSVSVRNGRLILEPKYS